MKTYIIPLWFKQSSGTLLNKDIQEGVTVVIMHRLREINSYIIKHPRFLNNGLLTGKLNVFTYYYFEVTHLAAPLFPLTDLKRWFMLTWAGYNGWPM